MSKKMDGWMDIWMDIWMDGWMDIWMDWYLFFGDGSRHITQQLFHGGSFLLQEIVHEFHKVLFALEAGEVGQRLQRLGDQRQITRRLLARIFYSHNH